MGEGSGRMRRLLCFATRDPGVYRYPVDFALYRYDDDIIASLKFDLDRITLTPRTAPSGQDDLRRTAIDD